MKPNLHAKAAPSRRLPVLALAGLLAVSLAVAFAVTFGKLRALWLEQCVLTDVARQVSVETGPLVPADTIREIFGLKAGANLATIDFDRIRREALARYPTIREIRIARQLPDKVTLRVFERKPSVRLNVTGGTRETGRVADTEGVVFRCRRDTQLLPVVREAPAAPTAVGKRLEGRARAALNLIEMSRDAEFAELKIQSVDITKRDFLLATLGSYARAKFAWEGMDDVADPESNERLRRQLRNLSAAIASRIRPDTTVWNVTLPDRVYSDTPRLP